MDSSDGFVIVHSAIKLRHSHAPQTHRGNFKTTASKFAKFHQCLLAKISEYLEDATTVAGDGRIREWSGMLRLSLHGDPRLGVAHNSANLDRRDSCIVERAQQRVRIRF